MKIIPLTKGMVAIVDDDDYEWVSLFNWHAYYNARSGYWRAARKESGSNRKIDMAREICGALPGEIVDHENHQTLDNQKHNLRRCTKTQNQGNRMPKRGSVSGMKGVTWDKRAKQWHVKITANGKPVNLGRFDDKNAAASAYDAAAVSYFGDFALTNQKLGLIKNP